MDFKRKAALTLATIVVALCTTPTVAHADRIVSQACRGWYDTKHAGVLLNPCIELFVDGSGLHFKSYMYVTSPQTDVRVYEQIGTSSGRTSSISWGQPEPSFVLGPNVYNQRVDAYTSPGIGGGISAFCAWSRVRATDGGTQFAYDVESKPACFPS